MKYALIYGGLSGLAIIATITVGLNFADQLSFLSSMWFGYLVMLIALSFIFVGVRRYRDVECGGVIRFLPAFGLGLGIALVAALTYVIVWEIYLAATNYAFMDAYIAGEIRSLHEQGVSGAALAEQVAAFEEIREAYRNPVFRVGFTFLEIAPVGVLVALVSAALLRNPKMLAAR